MVSAEAGSPRLVVGRKKIGEETGNHLTKYSHNQMHPILQG